MWSVHLLFELVLLANLCLRCFVGSCGVLSSSLSLGFSVAGLAALALPRPRLSPALCLGPCSCRAFPPPVSVLLQGSPGCSGGRPLPAGDAALVFGVCFFLLPLSVGVFSLLSSFAFVSPLPSSCFGWPFFFFSCLAGSLFLHPSHSFRLPVAFLVPWPCSSPFSGSVWVWRFWAFTLFPFFARLRFVRSSLWFLFVCGVPRNQRLLASACPPRASSFLLLPALSALSSRQLLRVALAACRPGPASHLQCAGSLAVFLLGWEPRWPSGRAVSGLLRVGRQWLVRGPGGSGCLFLLARREYGLLVGGRPARACRWFARARPWAS